MTSTHNKIEFNGEPTTLTLPLNVTQLITQQNVSGKRFLVVINDELVPKSTWTETIVNAGDKVDIVTAITGG